MGGLHNNCFSGSLFSPDCAPQCRKDTPPGSPGVGDKLVISPTTYRAEPMEVRHAKKKILLK